AGLKLVPDGGRSMQIFSPDGGGEAILTVVHQQHSLFVIFDRHDSDHGTESLLGHNLHAVVDPDQDLWREVSSPPLSDFHQRFRSPLDGRTNLGAHGVGSCGADHRSEGGLGVERVAKSPASSVETDTVEKLFI